MDHRKRNASERYSAWKHWLWIFIQFLILFAICLMLLFRYVIGVAKVSGNSMKPTLQNGQTVWFNRLDRSYRAGDLICFRLPSGEWLVKRVIATGGDVIDLQDGDVYIDGKKIDESAYAHGSTEPEEGEVSYPYTVPDGSYFVMGDNREDSVDSRSFKAIVGAAVKGSLFNQ
ncbi:MAG: signal peptidase I [Bilifractor sp.]